MLINHSPKPNLQYQGKKLIPGTYQGRRIRPSNWYERIAELDAEFDPRSHKIHYAGHIIPIEDDEFGTSTIVDFDTLLQDRPDVYEELVEFIEHTGIKPIPLPSES